MKITFNIVKFLLLIVLIGATFIVAYNEAVEANDVYNENVESQNTLLKGRIALLEARIALLEEEVALSDQQILLLKELLESKDSEIDSLLGFARSTTDYQDLVRIVEAEAGGESLEGKLQVASVVLNRVGSFAGTVHDVIYQPQQFSPIADGRFNRVKVSEDSLTATEQIIRSGSITNALYFMNPDFSVDASRDWMRSLTYVDTVGNHEFYR